MYFHMQLLLSCWVLHCWLGRSTAGLWNLPEQDARLLSPAWRQSHSQSRVHTELRMCSENPVRAAQPIDEFPCMTLGQGDSNSPDLADSSDCIWAITTSTSQSTTSTGWQKTSEVCLQRKFYHRISFFYFCETITGGTIYYIIWRLLYKAKRKIFCMRLLPENILSLLEKILSWEGK